MSPTSHWAVFIDNTSEKGHLIDMLLGGDYPAYFKSLENQKGALFSQLALERFMDEEDRHGTKVLTASTGQFLRSMSSGERKKALLRHILNGNPDFLVLDNPFDNLDRDTQAELKIRLEKVSKEISIVQLLGRKTDLLPFIHHFARLDGKELIFPKMGKAFNDHPETNSVTRKQRTLSEMWKPSTDHPKVKNFNGGIPPPLQPMAFEDGSL
ncbi:MAG TPA: hypothetical protein VFM69_12785, partial [Pricia sp.]|nr:hypothetical protein [Pricia sp.]